MHDLSQMSLEDLHAERDRLDGQISYFNAAEGPQWGRETEERDKTRARRNAVHNEIVERDKNNLVASDVLNGAFNGKGNRFVALMKDAVTVKLFNCSAPYDISTSTLHVAIPLDRPAVKILSHQGVSFYVEFADGGSALIGEADPSDPDTFTLKEMREACEKSLRGEKLTEKEQKLADAKRMAIRSSMEAP